MSFRVPSAKLQVSKTFISSKYDHLLPRPLDVFAGRDLHDVEIEAHERSAAFRKKPAAPPLTPISPSGGSHSRQLGPESTSSDAGSQPNSPRHAQSPLEIGPNGSANGPALGLAQAVVPPKPVDGEPAPISSLASPPMNGGAPLPGGPIDYQDLDADNLSFKEIPGVGLVPKSPDANGNGNGAVVPPITDHLADRPPTPRPALQEVGPDTPAPITNGHHHHHHHQRLVRPGETPRSDTDSDSVLAPTPNPDAVEEDKQEQEQDQDQEPPSEYTSAFDGSPPHPRSRTVSHRQSVHFAPTSASLVSSEATGAGGAGVPGSRAGTTTTATFVGEVVGVPLPAPGHSTVCTRRIEVVWERSLIYGWLFSIPVSGLGTRRSSVTHCQSRPSRYLM